MTDYSNASRTLLFDIGGLRWDAELCELLGVPAGSLPEPRPSADVYGETRRVRRLACRWRASPATSRRRSTARPATRRAWARTPTARAASCSRTPAGELPEPAEGLLTTIAWGVDGRVDYALEAAIFVTGAAVQWLRDGLGVIQSAAETEELARSLDGNDGVYLVPAFTGLGSPHWDPYARGTIAGLTRGHRAGPPGPRRARGDGLPDLRRRRARSREASGVVLSELKADGGAVVNGWLMQFQADVLGMPVVVPEISETTALGAAYLAGVATGAWTEADVRSMWREAARYEPSMSEELREQALAGWARALGRAASNEAERIG